MRLGVWTSVLMVASALFLGEAASAQVNFAHNYLRPPCCGGDLLRGVRSAITMNELDTGGHEALVRVIARASDNLSLPGMIQGGFTYTNDVFPVDDTCPDTLTAQPYEYWASQPDAGGDPHCFIGGVATTDERHKYKVTRVSGSSTYWRVYRDGDPWSSTRDVGFNVAGFIGAGGRLTGDGALNIVEECYGCGSNTLYFQRTHEVCCSQAWTTINQSWKRQDPGWFIGDVPTPFTITF